MRQWKSLGPATVTTDDRWNATLDLGEEKSETEFFNVMAVASTKRLDLPIGTEVMPDQVPVGKGIRTIVISIARTCQKNITPYPAGMKRSPAFPD